MSNKRERRLRRKAARKALAAQPHLLKLREVALSAIAYIAEIDAPNLAEPFAIAHRRDELKAVVHAFIGRKPERRSHGVPHVQNQGLVHRSGAVEAAAGNGGVSGRELSADQRRGGPRVPQVAGVGAEQRHDHRGADRAGGAAGVGSSVKLRREVETKRRELKNAALRLGAVGNFPGHGDVSALVSAVEEAGRELVRAEKRLADDVAANCNAQRKAV